jgi:hypothetical protein
VNFLTQFITRLWQAIYGDEATSTLVSPTSGFGSTGNLYLVQHAIDSAAGGPSGSYSQQYAGDYFNGSDWRVVVRDAFSQLITDLGGGLPADGPRSNSSYAHPLSALHANLVFDPTPAGNRGIWEQIIDVGSTVKGEMVFPLGQSGFIDNTGLPDRNTESLQHTWRFWRFLPMLHVGEDLASDPDGDIDGDGVLDGYERYYFGSNSPAPTADADADGLTLVQEYQMGLDPTDADTEDNGISDAADDIDRDGCSNGEEVGLTQQLGGRRDALSFWDVFDTPNPARTTLSAQIEDETVPPFNITVANANTLPAAPSTLYVNNEKFVYDSKTMTTIHVVARAVDPTVSGTHAISSPVVSNVRDGAVTISDIAAVVSRFGSSGNKNTRQLSPVPAAPAYHPTFDRLPALGGMDMWDLRLGNGSVSIQDISLVVAQFGLNCTGAP